LSCNNGGRGVRPGGTPDQTVRRFRVGPPFSGSRYRNCFSGKPIDRLHERCLLLTSQRSRRRSRRRAKCRDRRLPGPDLGKARNGFPIWAVLWVERDGPGRVLELQSDITQRTFVRSAVCYVQPVSQVDTDDFGGHRLLREFYGHRSVDHEVAYVTEHGACRNTAGGKWSITGPCGDGHLPHGVGKSDLRILLPQDAGNKPPRLSL